MVNTLTRDKPGSYVQPKVDDLFDTEYLKTDLKGRSVRGGFWVFALRIVTRLFGLGRTIALARLLAPADFGLFGIALLAMSALETFSQTGFHAALVQKKQDTRPYLDTAWTVQLIRAVVLALIAFSIAPYVASFFDTPATKPIIQVIAFSVLIGGFANIGVIYFQKELEFHKQFIYQLTATLADFSVAITAAFLLRSVWALVFGLLARSLVGTVLSYFIHPYRPRLGFNLRQFKELFGFGRWVLGSSILVFLTTQGDDIFVGKLLGTTMLGFYQMAYRLSNMPATEITHVISQVTFPAYSKLQDNLPRLREAYLKVLQITAFISFPLAGLIFILAPDFTSIFLGEKWMPMVPAMQVLAIWGLMRSIGATTGPIFYAKGRPDLATKLQVLNLVLLGGFVYVLTIRLGILGTSIALASVAVLTCPIHFYIIMKFTQCKAWDFYKQLCIPAANTAVVLVMSTSVKALFRDGLGIVPLGMSIVSSGVLYVCLSYLAERVFEYGALDLVKTSYLWRRTSRY